MARILHKAEATGRLLHPVEAHYDSLDVSAEREQFIDLVLTRVEGEVAYVQSSTLFQLVIILISRQLLRREAISIAD